MCEFQHLYFGEEGYVIRCKDCGHYQVAYSSTVLTLDEKQLHILRKSVKRKYNESADGIASHTKNIIVQTPCNSICLLFTKSEAFRFSEMLETADSEASALSLLNLFNS